jgi:hypothetical protein
VTLPAGSPGLAAGMLVQFGFTNETINYLGTGVFYDNLDVRVVPGIFATDFEDLQTASEAPPGSDLGAGWLTYVLVLGPEGYAYNNGQPFPAPNGNLISQIDDIEGNNVLNVYTDYGNGDAQAKGIVTSVFQEFTIQETIQGDLVMTFDAYVPEGGLEAGATAGAFINVLNPNDFYSQVARVDLDLTDSLTGDFQTFSVTLPAGSPGLAAGMLVQFGFTNETINYLGTGVFYDNLVLTSGE